MQEVLLKIVNRHIILFGDGIAGLFGKSPKDNTKWDKIKGKSLIGNIGKVPGCTIKCVVKINKDLKKNITLSEYDRYDDIQNDIYGNAQNLTNSDIKQILKTSDFKIDLKKIQKQIDPNVFFANIFKYNTTDNIQLFDINITGDGWVPVEYQGPLKFEDLQGNVNSKTEYACAFIYQRFLPKLVNNWEKHYNLYININDWKRSNRKKNQTLLNRNTIQPLMRIDIIIDNDNYDKVFSVWYDWSEFRKMQPVAYIIFKNRILSLTSVI